MSEDGRAIPITGREHALYDLPDTILVEQALHRTKAVQLLGFAFLLSADLHRCAVICLELSSDRRRWSSTVRILPVTAAVACTTNLPTSRLSSASIRSWSCAAASCALAMICAAAAIALLLSSCWRRAAADRASSMNLAP